MQQELSMVLNHENKVSNVTDIIRQNWQKEGRKNLDQDIM